MDYRRQIVDGVKEEVKRKNEEVRVATLLCVMLRISFKRADDIRPYEPKKHTPCDLFFA